MENVGLEVSFLPTPPYTLISNCLPPVTKYSQNKQYRTLTINTCGLLQQRYLVLKDRVVILLQIGSVITFLPLSPSSADTHFKPKTEQSNLIRILSSSDRIGRQETASITNEDRKCQNISYPSRSSPDTQSKHRTEESNLIRLLVSSEGISEPNTVLWLRMHS